MGEIPNVVTEFFSDTHKPLSVHFTELEFLFEPGAKTSMRQLRLNRDQISANLNNVFGGSPVSPRYDVERGRILPGEERRPSFSYESFSPFVQNHPSFALPHTLRNRPRMMDSKNFAMTSIY
jgi:hypothetical protein